MTGATGRVFSVALTWSASLVLGWGSSGCGGAGGGVGPASAGGAATGPQEVCCCGLGELFIVDVDEARRDPASRAWSWKPADSPQIAERHRSKFEVLLECKPVRGGSAMLICASWRGGVALVRRSDKRCLFYAGGHGGHSAEMIGDDLLAYALATSRNELRLYKLEKAGPLNAKPAWKMPLKGGHAVVWDPRREVLWALASDELVKLKVKRGRAPSAEVLKRFKLPKTGGNDLIALDAGRLAVSTKEAVYAFDVDKGSFSPLGPLGKVGPVKGMSLHPGTGQIVYTVGEGQFTDKVRFLGGRMLVFKGRKIYKARWNVRK